MVIAASVIAGGIIAPRWGGSAAAEEATADKVAALAPVSLAGRWSGAYYGYGKHAGAGECSDTGCTLTYDFVACKEGWCGIAVGDGKSCGDVGVRLAVDAERREAPAFKGRLEVEKGSAPYTVEAWYNEDKETGTQLHFLGDTGPELMLFRRSYPFEATLTRAGDAVCKLDKATS